MDYLDPRKRRAYNRRLVTGYVLLAIVIGLSTYLITAAANGYGFNTKTGQIVQNGLLFADSTPGGAQIYLNGHDRHTATSARLVLAAGNYTLTLKKPGYRDWTRQFTLSEQSVARYVYPFLFPNQPVESALKTYNAVPGLMTQSPDLRWLLVQDPAAAAVPVFDMYDTATLDRKQPQSTRISFPAGLLTSYSSKSKIKVAEWSTDNNRVLLLHSFKAGQEFVIFDRARPAQSFNVNRLFKSNPDQVSLFDKKPGQLYLFNKTAGSLTLADTGDGTQSPVIARHVLAYKTFGRNLITYVTDSGAAKGMVSARIWSSGVTYKLNDFPAGRHYLVDVAQFQGNFYYAAGSDTADRINIYKNPLDGIKNPSISRALPILALHIKGSQKISFSANARFIGVENGQRFAVYDIETGDSYQYPVTEHLAGSMNWMDGHRYIGDSQGKVLVMDYDGTNRQLITDSAESIGGLFSRDFKHMITIAKNDSGRYVLRDVDLRAGTDLPR